jgi:glycosyltransferase involved in cell wall biosynthesis
MVKVRSLRLIFISLGKIDSIEDRSIYADLMRYFVTEGHHVTIISPLERGQKGKSGLFRHEHYSILKVKTLKNQKTNPFEKMAAVLSIDYLIKAAIKKYLVNEMFDLAMYATPPITLTNSIRHLKNEHKIQTYLLLKDIFPQNAVDLKIIGKGSLIYKYFKLKESQLYALSDYIGCMSEANVNFFLKNNPEINSSKVEICPNSIELKASCESQVDLEIVKEKLGIVTGQRVFIYGGNLGKPQGIKFLKDLLDQELNSQRSFFIIIGDGTEYSVLEEWYNRVKPDNVILKSYMPIEEYNEYVRIADVGLIFLDYRFTIPNYPSRLLGYLDNCKPIIAFTDETSDVGLNAEKRGYGKWCRSNDLKAAMETIEFFSSVDNNTVQTMGHRGYEYLKSHYSVNNS